LSGQLGKERLERGICRSAGRRGPNLVHFFVGKLKKGKMVREKLVDKPKVNLPVSGKGVVSTRDGRLGTQNFFDDGVCKLKGG